MSPGSTLTVADVIVDQLLAAGVRRIYGMPGGGSNMVIVAAAAARGIEFVLAHHEPAAMFMAAGEAEATGVPGVCLATLGPGLANSVNGLAHCLLDRVPVLLLSDCADDPTVSHQSLDQRSIVRATVKHTQRVDTDSAETTTRDALRLAAEEPAGPVHLELSGRIAASAAGKKTQPRRQRTSAVDRPTAPREAVTVLGRALRPVLLVGMAARDPESTAAVRSFLSAFDLPVLTTYKAKGVVREDDEWCLGLFTNSLLEDRVLRHADAVVAVGLDAVELMPGAWKWDVPTIALGVRVCPRSLLVPGTPADALNAIRERLQRRAWMPRWEAEQLRGARLSSDAFSELDAPDAVQPADVVRSARRLSPADSLATVDAGSHMFPATLFWTTSEPRRFLISNGLATMGYSLPAAIGAALSLGKAPTICFTGDGGLSMCVSELETAARTNARIVVVVFNDQSLSLIKTKQERREEPTAGLDFGAIDWAGAASAMGVPGVRVSSLAQFDEAFRKALAHDGPSLIDVQTDPRSYATMLQTIRG